MVADVDVEIVQKTCPDLVWVELVMVHTDLVKGWGWLGGCQI